MTTMPTLLGPNGRPISGTRPVSVAPPPSRESASRSTLTSRVNTRFFSGFTNILAALPDPDPIMAKEGSDIWRRMNSDGEVFAADFQLEARLLARPWNIEPPEHLAQDGFALEVAAYVRSIFDSLSVEAMLRHLYKALRTKHAGGQIIYRLEEGTLVPDEFIAERPSIFRFDHQGGCYINVQGLPKQAEPFKWMIHVNNPDPERPSGQSIYERVYWPWRLKHMGWKLWATAVDRFAVPTLAALIEQADDADFAGKVADSVTDSLMQIESGTSAVLEGVTSLQVLRGNKALEGFDVFLEACDRSIWRGLMTTTLTVSEGKQGAERGDTSVHDDAANAVAEYYGRQLAESITKQLVAYTALLRYGEVARPVLPCFVFDFEGVLSLDRLLKLMEHGVPVSKRAIYGAYKAPEPSGDDDVFVSLKASPGAPEEQRRAQARLQRSGDVATLEFPAEDEDIVRAKLETYLRDQEIKARFSRLREDGASVDAAFDQLKEEYPLSRSRIRDIVYS